MKKKLHIYLTLIFLVTLSSSVFASHYRSGAITWREVSPRVVEFTVTTSWRNDFVGEVYLDYGAAVTDIQETSNQIVSDVNGVATRVQKLVVTYPDLGPYTVSWSSCCRIDGLSGGGSSGNMVLSIIVDLTGGNKNSPVCSLPATVNLPIGSTAATFQVPANDLDGDVLSYRLATVAELNGNQPAGFSIDATTGLATVNTSLANYMAGQLYMAGIVVSDGKTSVFVDFLIAITQPSTPPEFLYGPTPVNASVIIVSPGQNVNFQVSAQDLDVGGSISNLYATGIPGGASFLNASGNPAISTFNWTPTSNDFGGYVLNFVAQDDVGVQVFSSVTIQVSLKPIFDVPPTPAAGVHNVYSPGQIISFPVQVSDPDPADVVRIVDVKGKDMMGQEIPLYSNASFSVLPSLAANPTDGVFNWATQGADWGNKYIYFWAEDSYGDRTRHEVNVLINTNPFFISTPPTAIVKVAEAYSYDVVANDADITYGDILDLHAIGMPTWLTFTDNGDGTAKLSGTPTLTDVGNFNFRVEAHDINHHDNIGGIPFQNISITVSANTVPTISIISNQSTCPNSAVSDLAFTISDAETVAGSLTLSATSSNQTLLPGANIVFGGSGANRTVSLTPALGENGTSSVVVTVDDGQGGTAISTFIFTVEDNIAPIFTSVPQINVNTDLNTCGAVVEYQTPANITFSESFVQNQSSASCGAWNTFQSQLLSTLSYKKLTIKGSLGLTGVSVTDPAKVLQIANALRTETSVSITDGGRTWLVSEGCGSGVELSASGNFCACETNEYVVRPCIGNSNWGGAGTATCNADSQTITVVFELNGNGGVSATDNCDNNPTIVQTAGLPSGSVFPVGTTTNTFKATDASGNSSSSSFDVVVTDNQIPVITSNGDKNVTTDLNVCGASVVVLATAGDNCTVGLPTGVRSDGLALDAVYPVGTTTITWNVSDANSNDAVEVTQTIVVTDNQLPVITSNGNKNVTTDLNVCGATVVVSATAADNCTVDAPTGVRSDALALDAVYPVGTTTITWNVSDANSNTAVEVVQTIIVTDNQIPVITSNGDKNVNTDLNVCSATVVVTATAVDNCTVGLPTGVRSDGLVLDALYPVGTTTIAWNATDANNNNAVAVTQTIVVTDIQKPVAITKNITVQLNAAGNATILAADVNNGSTDACGIATLVLDKTSFSCANFGVNTVILTVTDNNGNVATQTAIVTVEDKVAPVVITKNKTIQLNAVGTASIVVADVNNGSTDNCGISLVELDKMAFTCANVGANTVTLKVTDNNGNVATQTAVITVEDKIAPVVFTKNITVQLDASSNILIAAADVNNGSTDNCGISLLELDKALFSCANVGDNIVTLKVTDNSGNVSTKTAIVTVVNTRPNIIRKHFDDVIFFDNSSKAFIAYSWYKNGVLVSGQTAQYFKDNGILNGSYYAIAKKTDGTFVTTCPLTFSVSIVDEYLKIAPNPVKSNASYQILTNVDSAKLQNARITVFTILGVLVNDKIVDGITTDMIAPNTEGIYVVRMTLANGKYFTKNLLVKN
ncbi:HYR domain-containing protein [Flavobacterium sp. LB2P84]|uniref:HYR domain-containing protein n=1 Tax=Flavobacterium yafengii TaxID=3041253 RepID=UPI0024A9C06C|nr:HYR domain-containing protein [Flavobacterium yafengii]MDI6034540.1 HYR domain-containing protein [Flavobacterium yafengii]